MRRRFHLSISSHHQWSRFWSRLNSERPPIEFGQFGPMAIPEIFAINLPQPTYTMVTYVLTIEHCNFTSAAISQFVPIEFVVCDITLREIFF
jgi:hypothetical protein